MLEVAKFYHHHQKKALDESQLYLSDSLSYLSLISVTVQLYTLTRALRSASDTFSLQIPRTRLFSVGSCALSCLRPDVTVLTDWA